MEKTGKYKWRDRSCPDGMFVEDGSLVAQELYVLAA
jgi:hypothetical protein